MPLAHHTHSPFENEDKESDKNKMLKRNNIYAIFLKGREFKDINYDILRGETFTVRGEG